MADIIYDWGRGDASIGIESSIDLPQFRILGYKRETRVEVLSTGKRVQKTAAVTANI